MADRREFQQERSRLLRDPEAGDDTQVEAAENEGFGGTQGSEVDPFSDVPFEDEALPAGTDAVEDPVEQDRAANPQDFLARPEVEVTAAIVDDGIAITFLIPHGLIGVALSE